MLWWPKRIGKIAAALFVLGCGGRAGSEAGPGPVEAWPYATIAAIESVAQDEPAHIGIDPVPVTLEKRPVLPTGGDYEGGGSDGIALIRSYLDRAGIEEVRALPLNDACSGLLVPPAAKETSGCPSEMRSHFVFGVPRPHADSLWAVRMLRITYRPHGRSATLYRVVLRRGEGRFVVIRRDPLIAFD